MSSDYELRRAELVLADPYCQTGLSDSIPAGSEIVEVLNTYVFTRWPREKAWCAKCRAHRHRYGFTAELSDRSKVMLGSKCGAEAFGRTWQELHKSFKNRFKRQSYLHSLDELGPRLLSIGQGLLRWLPHAKRHAVVIYQFQSAMTGLFELIQRAARKDGVLTVYVQVKTEERAKWRGGAASEWVSATYHQIKGRSFLAVSNPESLIESSLELVRKLGEALSNSDSIRTRDLVRLSKEYGDMVEGLHKFADAHEAWPQFASHTNLSGIAEWATQCEYVSGNYVAKGSCLMWTTQGKAVHVNAGYEPLDKKLLRQLSSDPLVREKGDGPAVRARRRQHSSGR